MKAIIIPSILAGTVLLATTFAFMPIDRATTVHNTIQANTARIAAFDSATSTAADQNIRITCPAASDGCHILEVYVEETVAGGAGVRIDDIDATINGDAIATLVDIDPDNTINDARELIAQAGGIGLGAGDILTLDTNDGATDDAARYNARVVATVEGGTSITVDFV